MKLDKHLVKTIIDTALAKKNQQAETIVLDLSKTTATEEQLGNIVKRVQGAGATNIKNVIVIKKGGGWHA